MLECEQIDTLFIQSEQVVSKNLLKDRMIPQNAYLGKIRDGEMFPLRSGTRIKGYRLGRVGVPNENGWTPVVDEQCSTNACDFEPETISHGSSEFFYSLVKRDFRTDWICIDSMSLRAMPEQELQHLEEGFRDVAKKTHEEFRRSRYALFSENKVVAKAPQDGGDSVDGEVCGDDDINTQGYVFETRSSGEMNENAIRVAVPPTQLDQIAGLSMDMLDYAQATLVYQNESFMPGTNLFDVLLPDYRLSNRLVLQENTLMGSAGSNVQGGYDLLELNQTFGTDRVIRNYSFRVDSYAMKFFPDTVFNATLTDEDFDLADPDTWPRLVRVHPYVLKKDTKLGVKWVVNQNYRRAPFGITVILTPRVMDVMSFPNEVSVGGASKIGGVGWDGTISWKNPDWPCNIKRNKGFWMQCYRLAARPGYTEEGWTFLHRINPTMLITGIACPIPTRENENFVSPYCFDDQDAAFLDGGVNLAQDN